MEHKRGSDPRIYIVTLLFLSCIVTGGVFLALYLVLPDSDPFFLQAGMVFVGLPWLFWFLAYVYSYILKPCTLFVSKNVVNFDPEKGDHNNNKNKDYEISKNATSASDLSRTTPRDDEKNAQFGNVADERGAKEEDRNEDDRSNPRSGDDDEESSALRLSVGNK